jgi:hypothetical protein
MSFPTYTRLASFLTGAQPVVLNPTAFSLRIYVAATAATQTGESP